MTAPGHRAARGLKPYVYTTDPDVNPRATVIRAQNVLDLREALAAVYAAAGQQPPTCSTNPAFGVTIRASDISEIREALERIE